MARTANGTRRRAGLPAAKSIVSEKILTPPRPPSAAMLGLAQSYRIIRTNEVDPKDVPIPRSAVPAIGAAAIPGDAFAGTARKAAKLAVASGAAEKFQDLDALIDTLPSKTAMKKHQPPITKEAGSGRVAEEKRNVRLDAFLYAASREDDNDFHLIIGRDPASTPHIYMTVEVSGLPPKTSKSFTKLSGARKSFKAFFGKDLPGTSYDFYDPPIPVRVEGSLFFDMSHASGQGPGPASLRKNIPTIWEVHPVSKIVFEP
jgi:hypothetical protein